MTDRYNRDYCSSFSENIRGIYIGGCCKKHDNDVGQTGTYNPITPHIVFYRCLKELEVNFALRSIITFGGTIGSLVRYPYFAYKKYRYRKMRG